MIGIIAVIGAPFVVGLLKRRAALKRVWKCTIAPIIWIARYISKSQRSVVTSGLNILRRRYRQVDFYLTKRGIRTLKLNLTAVPNVEETWNNPYLTSPAQKACYLAAQLSKFMNPQEANQQPDRRANSIRQLCGTPAIHDLLASGTFNSDVFCALVSAYVVEQVQEHSPERFQSFPVPYCVVEEIVKDLIGEEKESHRGWVRRLHRSHQDERRPQPLRAFAGSRTRLP